MPLHLTKDLSSMLGGGGGLGNAAGGFSVAPGNKLASGGVPLSHGSPSQAPWYTRSEARQGRTGAFRAPSPGRVDVLQSRVPTGAFVVPADVVSGLGQGNSEAGHNVLNAMFKGGPYGTSLPKAGGGGMKMPRSSPRPKFAKGGKTGTTDIMAAGGEHLIDPKDLERKFGNLNRGHAVMHDFVKKQRAKNIKTLQKLPGPKK